jgi:hypothetical protein
VRYGMRGVWNGMRGEVREWGEMSDDVRMRGVR